jgi:nucleotide-binding universal stress UspA family protein
MNVHESGSAAPLGDHNPVLRTMLVGVDGSRGSSAAVRWSARFAEMAGAEIVAAHILTYNREFLRDLTFDTIRTWRLELVRDLETRWTEQLRSIGVAHRCEALLAGRLPGGTSSKLVHQADRPVVVVPQDLARRDPD